MMKAVSTEMFPICGMDQSTMDYLLANMAVHYKREDVTSKCLSRVLSSASANRKIKDKSLELKEIILNKYYEDDKYLFMATRNGIVKKTPIKDYENIRKNGLAAINLREDDKLIEVKVTDNSEDILLFTKFGQCIRFKETEVRSTGRTTMGVIGMNLAPNDVIIAMQTASMGEAVLLVSSNGLGKRTRIDEFTTQNRGGKGVKCYKITEKSGNLVGVKSVENDDELMLITTEGIIIRIQVSDVTVLGRITTGVKLINLKEGVSVASIAKVVEDKTLMPPEEAKEETDESENSDEDSAENNNSHAEAIENNTEA